MTKPILQQVIQVSGKFSPEGIEQIFPSSLMKKTKRRTTVATNRRMFWALPTEVSSEWCISAHLDLAEVKKRQKI